MFHVGASAISLAPTYFISQSALILLLLLSKPDPFTLGSGLVFGAGLKDVLKTDRTLQDKLTNFDTKFVNFLFISKYMTDCAAAVSVAAIFISRRRKHNEAV